MLLHGCSHGLIVFTAGGAVEHKAGNAKLGDIMAKKQLIFVYNADGGTFNAIMDSAHKLFAPSTYQCSLCAITHGMLTMRHEWKDYMRNLPYETRFYHRDGFRQEWPNQLAKLPAIFMQEEDGSLTTVISAEELNQQSSIAQLTAMLGRKIAERKAL
jgi:hypothetical protein